MTHEWDRIKRFRRNGRGGIEGLPLELMIIVIVATLGTAILIGWMGSVEEPKTIGSVTANVSYMDSTIQKSVGGTEVTITVTDNEGAPIKGAVAVISGCGIPNTAAVTDSAGKAVFKRVLPTVSSGQTGYINVHVTANGYGEDNSLRIVVV